MQPPIQNFEMPFQIFYLRFVKPNRFISKSIAFICLLALSQKMGAGLCLHNLFHNKDYKSSSATLPDNKRVNYACNCIDDFTMPFTETDIVELPSIATSYSEHTSLFYKEPLSFSFHL